MQIDKEKHWALKNSKHKKEILMSFELPIRLSNSEYHGRFLFTHLT